MVLELQQGGRLMTRITWFIVILAVAIALLPACAKKQVTPIEKPQEEAPALAPPIEETKPEQTPFVQEKPVSQLVLDDVFFDFDRYNIKDEYKSVLQRNAELLRANPDKKLRVEGHCDERGTNEYNMALGEKRAKAAVDFYTTYGIKPDRLTWISYGEEKPFDPGHNETAWAKNRRAHMVLQ
jgi:peptidoglycan-associated lipoprotein